MPSVPGELALLAAAALRGAIAIQATIAACRRRGTPWGGAPGGPEREPVSDPDGSDALSEGFRSGRAGGT